MCSSRKYAQVLLPCLKRARYVLVASDARSIRFISASYIFLQSVLYESHSTFYQSISTFIIYVHASQTGILDILNLQNGADMQMLNISEVFLATM